MYKMNINRLIYFTSLSNITNWSTWIYNVVFQTEWILDGVDKWFWCSRVQRWLPQESEGASLKSNRWYKIYFMTSVMMISYNCIFDFVFTNEWIWFFIMLSCALRLTHSAGWSKSYVGFFYRCTSYCK